MEKKSKGVRITKGSVFCVELKDSKAYFQYIAIDSSQIRTMVIRVFKERYPLDYIPDIEDIVRGEVQFYAHTLIRVGLWDGAWYKVGSSKYIDDRKLPRIIFVDNNTSPIVWYLGLHRIIGYCLSLWRISCKRYYSPFIPPIFRSYFEIGTVVPYPEIVDRIERGYYMGCGEEYLVLRPVPLNDYDTYTRRKKRKRIEIYHFRGSDLIRKSIIKNGMTFHRYDSSKRKWRLFRMKFWDFNWSWHDFITEDEFEILWNLPDKS